MSKLVSVENNKQLLGRFDSFPYDCNIGMQDSLAIRLVWDQDIARSNRVIPTYGV